MLKSCCLAITLLSVSVFFGAVGQERPLPLRVQEAAQAVVRIAVAGIGAVSGKEDIARASGVIATVDGYILTCGHLFWVDSPEDQLILRVLLIAVQEKRFRLTDLQICEPNPVVDVRHDLALIKVKQQLEGLPLGETMPGALVWFLGYQGPGNEVTIIQGVVKFVAAERLLIEVDTLPGEGMSGSAVVNEDGALVGIVVATLGDRFVVATLAGLAPALYKTMKCQQ